MRVPRVQLTVRRMIELILFVALILGLVIQSDRAMRRERELARCHEATRTLLLELRAARALLGKEDRAEILFPTADK
jgi:hypothetical protein